MQAHIPGSTENVVVIYEVNLHIAKAVADRFADWLPGHVEEMLALPGFIDAVIAREEADDSSVAWSVRYRLQNRQALDDYFAEHAERMRADGIERFGEHMHASRRILTETLQLRAG